MIVCAYLYGISQPFVKNIQAGKHPVVRFNFDFGCFAYKGDKTVVQHGMCFNFLEHLLQPPERLPSSFYSFSMEEEPGSSSSEGTDQKEEVLLLVVMGGQIAQDTLPNTVSYSMLELKMGVVMDVQLVQVAFYFSIFWIYLYVSVIANILE